MRNRLMILSVTGVIVLTMAACDTTPPVFTRPLNAAYVVGGQIPPSDSTGESEAYTWTIPKRLTWLAADDDPACEVRYDIVTVWNGDEPSVTPDTGMTGFDYEHYDYDGAYGGGSGLLDGYRVVARDCADNELEAAWLTPPIVYQEDGYHPSFGPDPTIAWSGTWSTQAGPWTSGGHQRYTSERSAAMEFTLDFSEGQNVALVMAQGPGRGSAAVYVDGTRVGTVNTYAATDDNRRIHFNRRMPAGTHTLRVVNLATAGHPRIDIDAILA